MDEFDAARRLFRGAAPFHFLRDLVGSAETELHFLLTSRRDIAKIELQAGSDFVYFYNDLEVVNLGMFGKEDLDIYFSKFTDIRIQYSGNFRKRMLWWCGAHPYLLGKFGWEVAEMCRRNKKTTVNETDVDTVGAKIEDSVLKNYYKQNLIPLLQDLEIHDNLFQTLFESKSVRTEEETEAIGALKGYGLIKTKNRGYTAYSDHFHNYLQELYESSAKPSSAVATALPYKPSAKSSGKTNATDLTGPVNIRFTEEQLVPFEEDPFHEFKDISNSQRPDSSIANTADEYAVAFLNREGGRIFWGINNSRHIVGVSLNTEQRDNVRKLVSEKITDITPPVSIENYKLKFHNVYNFMEKTIEDLWVVELVVSPPQKIDIFYTKSNELFVKTDGGKKKLAGTAATAFIQSKKKLVG